MPLLSLEAEPNENMAFKGRLASTSAVMLLLLMLLLSLPPAEAVEKKMIPAEASVLEPSIRQNCTVLEQASLMKRIVEVPAVAEVLVLVIIKLTVEPVALTLPSMFTLSAPFKSITGAPASVPLMVRPEVVGYMVNEVHAPAFNTAEAVSVVPAVTVRTIVLPVCV